MSDVSPRLSQVSNDDINDSDPQIHNWRTSVFLKSDIQKSSLFATQKEEHLTVEGPGRWALPWLILPSKLLITFNDVSSEHPSQATQKQSTAKEHDGINYSMSLSKPSIQLCACERLGLLTTYCLFLSR